MSPDQSEISPSSLQSHELAVGLRKYPITVDTSLHLEGDQMGVIKFRGRDWGLNWQEYTVYVYDKKTHIVETGRKGFEYGIDTTSLSAVCGALLRYYGSLSNIKTFAVDQSTFDRLQAGSDLFLSPPQPASIPE